MAPRVGLHLGQRAHKAKQQETGVGSGTRRRRREEKGGGRGGGGVRSEEGVSGKKKQNLHPRGEEIRKCKQVSESDRKCQKV